MHWRVLLFSGMLSMTVCGWSQTSEQARFIERYKDIAIREMERAGIPASIKLAQSILESNWGKSKLAVQGNNYFGIKCGGTWNGPSVFQEDDEFDRQGRVISSCFRAYNSVESSFIAHSEFLHDPRKVDRYGPLFELDITDYKKWAIGLRKAGYATHPEYHKKLIDLIERYSLHQYDKMTAPDLIAGGKKERHSEGILVTNDVRYVLAGDHESIASIARRTSTSVKSLLWYNENLQNENDVLAEGLKVYLQPKRSSYRGREVWHTVKKGEKMFDISQLYAIQLSKLYDRNNMVKGMEPAEGEQIKLRGGKIKGRPKLLRETQLPKPTIPRREIVTDNGGWLDEIEVNSPSTVPSEDTKPEDPFVFRETQPDPVPATATGKPSSPQSSAPQKPTATVDAIVSKTEKPTETRPQPPPPRASEPVLPESVFGKDENQPAPTSTDYPLYHFVQKGDTLWNISRRYNTTVDTLKNLNSLGNDSIQLGMRLRVQ